MSTLGDFLNAGQQRRAWLNDTLESFIPPELRGWVNVAGEMNPVTNAERAGTAAQTMVQPGLSGWDRMAAAGDVASNMAAVLAPVGAASKTGVPAANAIAEALTAVSPMKGAVDDFLVDEFGGVGFGDEVASRGATVMDMLRSGRGAEVTDEMLDMGDPVQNARLNEWLFNNYDLPMDAASRAARAGEMGMDTAAFHETGKDFPAFDQSVVGARGSDNELPNGVFLKSHPNKIGVGRDTETQIPVVYRAGNVVDTIDRDHARSYLSASPDYVQAHRAAEIFDDQTAKVYDARFEGQAGRDWMAQSPEDYFAEADVFLENWNAENIRLAAEARGKADNLLAAEGVDTFRIAKDDGTFNRFTDTAIVRDPANIRSRFARFDPRLAHLRNLSAGLGLPLAAYLGQDPETLGAYLEAQ